MFIILKKLGRVVIGALIIYTQLATAELDANTIVLNQFEKTAPILSFDSAKQTSAFGLGFFGQTLLSDSDTGFSLGLRSNTHSLSFLGGEGDRSHFSGDVGFGRDQTYFHGGSFQAFSYRGFDWQVAISDKTRLGVSQVAVDSIGLEQRRAQKLSLAHRRLGVAYTQVNRSEAEVANLLNLSLDLKPVRLEAQNFTTAAGGRLNSIGLSWTGTSNDKFGLSISTKSNHLLEDESITKVMFTYQRKLGYSLAQAQTQQVNKSTGRVHPGILIGGGLVVAALAGSSGSSSQDSSVRLADQHGAARNVLNQINPQSVRENREYGGYIYQTPDGRYVATTPVRGEEASIELPFSLVPAGGSTRASYHTHGGNDPRYDNENFSFVDITSDQRFGVDGYLGTPLGSFLWHDVSSNRVFRLGTIRN